MFVDVDGVIGDIHRHLPDDGDPFRVSIAFQLCPLMKEDVLRPLIELHIVTIVVLDLSEQIGGVLLIRAGELIPGFPVMKVLQDHEAGVVDEFMFPKEGGVTSLVIALSFFEAVVGGFEDPDTVSVDPLIIDGSRIASPIDGADVATLEEVFFQKILNIDEIMIEGF